MIRKLFLYQLFVAIILSSSWGCDGLNLASSNSKNTENLDRASNNKNTTAPNIVAPKQRKFKFVYAAKITEITPGNRARIWIPLATSSDDQKILQMKIISPERYRRTTEKKYGNQILFFEGTANDAGEIPIRVEYEVLRTENSPALVEKVEDAEKEMFLAENSKVPVNGSLLGKLFSTNKPAGDPLTIARSVYDAIFARMIYDKPAGKPWGQGNAVWACNSKYGNCTDFHSLFIAVCRDLKVPAKFEIGFPLTSKKRSGKVAGYHCWAKFADGGKWKGVDISEAAKLKGKSNEKVMQDYYFGNLTPDRIKFTTGRDLQLLPVTRATETLNFLVYPYCEVNDKAHTKFKKKFFYQDIE